MQLIRFGWKAKKSHSERCSTSATLPKFQRHSNKLKVEAYIAGWSQYEENDFEMVKCYKGLISPSELAMRITLLENWWQ